MSDRDERTFVIALEGVLGSMDRALAALQQGRETIAALIEIRKSEAAGAVGEAETRDE